MVIRVGVLSTAHLHVWGYVRAVQSRADTELVGIWDDDTERGSAISSQSGVPFVNDLSALFSQCDAVVICSENVKHAELGLQAARAGRHILCEKPLVTDLEQGQALIDAVKSANVTLMTAFPCRFSPAYVRLRERVHSGDIGAVRAICATNRGTCPFSWFTDTSLSGGGAMVDHTVHVADLLRDLLGEEPTSVVAQVGNNMYGQDWEDTAMVSLTYPSGIFATIDSSWSRPKSFKTWGDVTMTVVGESGVIEMEMFGQQLDQYRNADMRHAVAGWGSDLDNLLVAEFVASIQEGRVPAVSGEDGLAATRVAMMAYASLILSPEHFTC